MALHTDLPIHKAGVELIGLAAEVHAQMHRSFKRTIGANLNPTKTIHQPVDRGIDFVGHVIKPWRRTTRKRTINTAIQRLHTVPAADVFEAGNSYLGLVRQASHSHVEQAAIANVLRWRGHAVKGDLTKIYRRKNDHN